MIGELARIIAARNFVVLDTETTGLEQPSEICQIAIIDYDGHTLLDTLVCPRRPIPPGATAIHHITDGMVQDAPMWPQVRPVVLALIAGKDVIVYNATYDRKLMHWSDEAYTDIQYNYKEHANWFCAMEAYAEHYGEIGYYGGYKWQSLTNALLQCGLGATADHSAMGDAQATLRLIYHITQGL